MSPPPSGQSPLPGAVGQSDLPLCGGMPPETWNLRTLADDLNNNIYIYIYIYMKIYDLFVFFCLSCFGPGWGQMGEFNIGMFWKIDSG